MAHTITQGLPKRVINLDLSAKKEDDELKDALFAAIDIALFMTLQKRLRRFVLGKIED